MVRTQVYLEDNQQAMIKVVSAKAKKSQAEVIREAIDIGLSQMNQKNESGTVGGLLALAELGKELDIKTPPDLSTRLDDYLYGKEE